MLPDKDVEYVLCVFLLIDSLSKNQDKGSVYILNVQVWYVKNLFGWGRLTDCFLFLSRKNGVQHSKQKEYGMGFKD